MARVVVHYGEHDARRIPTKDLCEASIVIADGKVVKDRHGFTSEVVCIYMETVHPDHDPLMTQFPIPQRD